MEITQGISQGSSPARQRYSRSARQWSSRLENSTTRLGMSVSVSRQVHVEFAGHLLEGGGQLVGAEGKRVGHDLDAQEEASRVEVAVLGRLEHRAAEPGDQPGHGSDDPHPVRAGDGQDVATHGRRYRPSPTRHISTNRATCTRWSPVSSGWNDDASTGPWRTRTGDSVERGQHFDPGPDRDHERGPDEHGRQRSGPLLPREADRPRRNAPGVRIRYGGPPRRAPERALVGPAVEHLARHQHQAGAGAQHRESSSSTAAGDRTESPVDSSSIESVVDSPPGSTGPHNPSRSSGRLPGRAVQPTA